MRALAFVSYLSWHPPFPFWWVPIPSARPNSMLQEVFPESLHGAYWYRQYSRLTFLSWLLTPFPKGSAFSLLGLCNTLKSEGPSHSWENIWGLGIPLLKRKNSHEKWWQLMKAHWQQWSNMVTKNLTSWRPQENGVQVVADTSSLCSLASGPSPHCGTMLPSYPEGWQLCPPSSEVKSPPTHFASVQTGWNTKARVL